MIVAVLDANVLVAAIAGRRTGASTPGVVLDSWRAGRFQLVVSEYLLDEVRRAMEAPFFHQRVSSAEIARSIELFATKGRVIPITAEVSGVASHHHDDPVIATAVSAGATYLVTGDKELRAVGAHAGVTFLTPREFLGVLDADIDGR